MRNREVFRLLRFTRPHLLPLLASVVLMACAGAAHGTVALLIGPVFDRVLKPESENLPVLIGKIPIVGREVYLNDLTPAFIHNVFTMIAVGILGAFLIKGITDYLGNYLVNYAGYSVVTDIRQRVFDKLLRQGPQFYELHSTGKLMSSIMSDIEKLQVATSHILADFLRQIFMVAGLLYVLLSKDWRLAVVSLTVLPFVLWPTLRFGKKIRRISRRAQDDTAELNQILQEALSGHQVVKAFGMEKFESKRFREAGRRLRSSNLRYVVQQALPSPIIEFFGALTIVVLLWYARDQIKAGGMTAGEFTSFVIALLMLYEPVKRLTGIHNIFEQAIGASQKVFGYLDGLDQIANKPKPRKLDAFRQSIVFQDVGFRYATSPDGFLLNSINLEVKAGEIVALVGPSGAGKTTLVNLVPRFQDVSAGSVLIDGIDVRDIEIESLRQKVGIVAQDTFLFNDTVANNIAYGRPGVDPKAVTEAAQNAFADEFISKLPQGYDTVIGERGLKLSGGQRQRIAIARALLKNAPILILDEATSHLDTESEMLVQHALSNLMTGRTVIVIAHRLSTVRRADKIVVLDRGRIVEAGRHDELVNGGGVYQRLHELQFLEAGPMVDL